MAERIKGITVEIGGDTVGLNKALSDVNGTSRNLQSELNQVQRLLKFDPTNVELLAQKQQLLTGQIENTSEKLNRLRSVQAQVEQQFQAGDLGIEQYRAFQREIAKTEQSLKSFKDQAEETNKKASASAKEMGGNIANAVAGAAAGAGAGAVISKALETAALDTKIDISFNVPEESKQSVKDAISIVEAYGVEGEAALEGVRRQWALNADQTDAQNAAVIKGAGAITAAFSEIDFTELVQETNEMASAMGISQEEALGMTNSLLKMGFPPDQLDIITEYGSQLSRAGYSAEEIQGIFAAGVETDSWNIDVLMDGLKEGRILMVEFGAGVDKAMQETIKGTGISATQLQNWGKAVAEGGEAGKNAMLEAAMSLSKIDDATKRNELGVKMFGTLWEEQGKNITETLINAGDKTGNLKANQDELNKSVATLDADPQVRLNNALSNMSTALTPLLATVAEWVAKIADWAAKNPELTAGITAVVVIIGILTGVIMALIPVIFGLSAAAGALNIALLPFTAIILGIIAAIGLLVAAFVWWRKNGDEVMKKVEKMEAFIKAKFAAITRKVIDEMKKVLKNIKEVWGKVTDFLEDIDLKQIGKDIINGLINGIGSMAKKVWNKASEVASGIGKAISKALKTGSPSKVTIEIGEDAGEGLEIGLAKTISSVQNTAVSMADALTNTLIDFMGGGSALQSYFDAIREDGDWLNDMLTHMPKNIANLAKQIGFVLAPTLEGTKLREDKSNLNRMQGMTVNIHSPKALNAREANLVWNKQMKKMALQW
jgi:phage-related minor tail protein